MVKLSDIQDKIESANKKDLTEFIFKYEDKWYKCEWRKFKWNEPQLIDKL